MLTKIRDDITETKKKERRETFNFYVLLLCLFFFIVLIIHLNLFVLMNIEVSGKSMESTLQSGDNLIVKRNAKVERGDIIIINKNTHKTAETDYYIIKRVIGVGGDKVEIKTDGKVYVNGEQLDESYLDDGQVTYIYDFFHHEYLPGEISINLEEDEIFYLGDNRKNSLDARMNGPCKQSDVIGVVSDFSVRHRKGLTKVFNFMRSIPDGLSDFFGCGSKD